MRISAMFSCCRPWLIALTVALGLVNVRIAQAADAPATQPTTQPAAAPIEPDLTGAFQTTPTAYSVPGYKAPADPAKPTAAEMDPKSIVGNLHAVAQATSKSIYSINFVWT